MSEIQSTSNGSGIQKTEPQQNSVSKRRGRRSNASVPAVPVEQEPVRADAQKVVEDLIASTAKEHGAIWRGYDQAATIIQNATVEAVTQRYNEAPAQTMEAIAQSLQEVDRTQFFLDASRAQALSHLSSMFGTATPEG